MGRDTIQLETAVSTISQEYLLEFTSEYGILEELHLKLPGSEDRIVDFPKGKVGVYTKFFEFANFRISTSLFLFDILEMDLFNLISAPNPTKDLVVASTSLEAPSVMEKSPLDFSSEDQPPLITNRGKTEDQAPTMLSQEVPSAES
ncbi:hypothetical protein Tco_1336927 [Tanacetum coccineum]